MAIRIDTVSGRAALTPRHAPYWIKVQQGCYIGYRKSASDASGAWLARTSAGYGKYQVHSLGAIDNILPASRYDEALKIARKWFEHKELGGANTEITVAQAWERYISRLDPVAAADISRRYKRWIEPDLRLAQTKMMRLTAGQVNDWRIKLENTLCIPHDKTKQATKPRSASAINRDVAVFRVVLNLALADGYASTDVWKEKLKSLKNATRSRDVYLDAQQRAKLIEQAEPDIAAFIRALSLLPLRPGAVAGLSVSNFDSRLGVLTVGKDKSGRDRKLTLPTTTAAFFTDQSKDKLPSAPLFSRADGVRWNRNSWNGPLKEAAKKAGLVAAATAYTLRHSVITDLISRHSLDILTVAALSGTSVVMIERHYGHLLQDRATAGLAKLAI